MINKIFFAGFAAAAAISLSSTVLAVEPADLVFRQEQGGRYIYCNNHERIRSCDLADTSVENPKFLMNNEGLTPDKYAMFVSFLNQTDRDNNDKATGKRGFDIEVDVLFRAREDTQITIEKLGFEVPEHHKIFLNGTQYAVEDEWGCFSCWADYLGMPIKQLNSGNVYEPGDFEETTFTLKKGEELWLSGLIDDYREVPFARSVNIMTDFRIDSGVCDVNIAALRSGTKLCDRSRFGKNTAYGSYVRDRQYKGISDGLNEVTVELSYTIDDSTAAGKLPVTVYNHYVPEGNTITDWYTHLNPRADEWSYDLCAESDMLSFSYYDPNKKYLYGSGVKDEDKDDYYHFDVNHIDSSVYEKGLGKRTSYIPNREITDNDGKEYACNLANYGVIYNYNVKLTNNGNQKRYLVYKLATSSNNLVYVKDSEGRVINDYVLSKGTSDIRLSDDMTCLPLPAMSTSEYTICVVLTPNYPGGMQNSLAIANYPPLIETYETERGGIEKDRYFDGKEYYRWADGAVELGSNREELISITLPKEVTNGISGNINEYELLWTGNGYVVRPRLYDAGWYENVKGFYRDVFLLDSEFNFIKKQTFGSYPEGFVCANGVYYAKLAGTVFRSDSFKWWDVTQNDLPCWNYGKYSLLTDNGRVYLSEDGNEFSEIEYRGFAPEYADSYGSYYYYADGRTLYLSENGLYWKPVLFNKKVKSFEVQGSSIIVNGEEERPLPEFNESFAMKIGDKYIATENETRVIDGINYAPLRETAEMLGHSVGWNDGEVTIDGMVVENIVMLGDISYIPFEDLKNAVSIQ